MKDFDQEREQRAARDRTFKIGGQTFTMKAAVHPDVLVGYEALDLDTGARDTLDLIDGIILDMIEPDGDAADRYREVRKRKDDPLSLQDMQSLLMWLIAEQTGRTPTQPPSPSPSGPGGTATKSTAASSSRGGKKATSPST